jgi:hypothetical protein
MKILYRLTQESANLSATPWIVEAILLQGKAAVADIFLAGEYMALDANGTVSGKTYPWASRLK